MGRLLAICVALSFSAATLHAQEFPWCVKLDAFTQNCAFADYNECTVVANNATSPATGVGRCVRNPNYQPPVPTIGRVKPAPAKTGTQQR
jgi:hypothetical protein